MDQTITMTQAEEELRSIDSQLISLMGRKQVLRAFLSTQKASAERLLASKDVVPKLCKLSDSIKVLGLTVRASNCLISEGIYQVGQLVEYCKWELNKIPNLGRKSLGEIEWELAVHGLILPERNSPRVDFLMTFVERTLLSPRIKEVFWTHQVRNLVSNARSVGLGETELAEIEEFLRKHNIALGGVWLDLVEKSA